jgi:hypothetical protein
VILLLAACLDHDPIPGGDPETFVAMQADFAGYLGWDRVTVGSGDTGHPDGERAVYFSALPQGGSDAFAVGTRVVKVIPGADIHAMVKRGGGYNAAGAVGWEWFELALATDGSPVIRWRGEVPPDGEAYGALPGADTADTGLEVGDCNTCHAAAASNDFVHVVPL